MLPLAADEDVHGSIIRELRRCRPDIDLVRLQEAGLSGKDDPAILAWAASEGRILITQDEKTMIGHAYARVRAGLPMPGVIVRPRKRVTIGQAVNELLLIACCGIPDDFQDQVRRLPR